MIQFLKTPDVHATKAMYAKYKALTLRHFGKLKLPTKSVNTLPFDFEDIQDLFDRKLDLSDYYSSVFWSQEPQFERMGGLAARDFMIHASSSYTFMMTEMQRNKPQDMDQALFEEISLFWLYFNLKLMNNYCHIVDVKREGFLIPVPPQLMRGMMHVERLPLQGPDETIRQVFSQVVEWMDMGEIRFIQADMPKELLALREQVVKGVLENIERYNKANQLWVYPSQLKQLADEKNERFQKWGIPRCEQVIYNQDAYLRRVVDQEAYKDLALTMSRIYAGAQDRTQIIFYLQMAHGGHVQALDVSLNKEGVLQVVHVDPARHHAQQILLTSIQMYLSKTRTPHKIIACSADLFDGYYADGLYAYALAGILGQTDVNALCEKATLSQPKFTDPLNHMLPPQEMKEVSGVKWFPVTALGYKAVLLGTDKQKMLERFKVLSPQNYQALFNKHTKMYGLDFEDGVSFVDTKRQRLYKKLNGKPFDGLTLEGIRKALSIQEGESDAKAVRTLAAGQGPMLYLRYLTQTLDKGVLEEAGHPSGNTALHYAFSRNAPQRAAVLLEAKVDATLENAQEKKPVDCMKETADQSLKELAKKFGLLKI